MSPGHQITATYGGSDNFAASAASSVLVQRVQVAPSLGSISATAWTVNQPSFTANIPINNITSGIPNQAVVVTGGGLPPGLSATLVGGNTAINISGTPTASGVYTFNLEVTDNAGITATSAVSYTITINVAPTIGAPSTTTGTYNTAFSATLTISGGTSPFNIASLIATGLPPGLSVALMGASTIRISGTPTAAGTYDNITVSINDATGATATSAPFTITIQTTSTQTVLTTAPLPALWATDQPITFTATVTFAAGTGSLLNGSLRFTDTVTSTNYTGTLAAGSTATHAVYTFTLAANQWAPNTSHTIVATYYSGPGFVDNPSITGSTSNTLSNANVRRFSHLTLSSSPDPVATQPTTFTAVLTGASGALAGQIVTFTINGIDYTATTNANGVATIDFTFADPGTFTVRVRFRNPLYNDADASITLDVAPNGVLV
jgi:hypothetical protein